MKIIAIDPGYERLGVAILEKTNGKKEIVLHSECFRTSAKETFTKRLLQIGNRIDELVGQHSPSALCIENLFMSNNQKTVMRISEVRGAILYIAEKFGLKIYELTPLQIKSAVTGNGASTKNEMMKMVRLIINTDKIKSAELLDDEFDAIAIGIAYFAYNNSQ